MKVCFLIRFVCILEVRQRASNQEHSGFDSNPATESGWIVYLGNTTAKLKGNTTANAIVSAPVLLLSKRTISELELVLVLWWFQRLVVYATPPQKKKIKNVNLKKRKTNNTLWPMNTWDDISKIVGKLKCEGQKAVWNSSHYAVSCVTRVSLRSAFQINGPHYWKQQISVLGLIYTVCYFTSIYGTYLHRIYGPLALQGAGM